MLSFKYKLCICLVSVEIWFLLTCSPSGMEPVLSSFSATAEIRTHDRHVILTQPNHLVPWAFPFLLENFSNANISFQISTPSLSRLEHLYKLLRPPPAKKQKFQSFPTFHVSGWKKNKKKTFPFKMWRRRKKFNRKTEIWVVYCWLALSVSKNFSFLRKEWDRWRERRMEWKRHKNGFPWQSTKRGSNSFLFSWMMFFVS